MPLWIAEMLLWVLRIPICAPVGIEDSRCAPVGDSKYHYVPVYIRRS